MIAADEAIEEMIGDHMEWCRNGGAQDDPASPLRQFFRQLDMTLVDGMKGIYDQGHRRILFCAIALCAEKKIALPDWVAKEFLEGMRKLNSFEVGSWDEAFGPALPRRKQLSALRKRHAKQEPVWRRIRELHAGGKPLDQALFDRVGSEFGISGGTAKSYYYDESRDRELPKE
jgi:hypothetical protein